MQELWGAETQKAVNNFPISGERIHPRVIHWLARIKANAALVNAELDLLDKDIAERIAEAAEKVTAGDYDDQFPIDVFQTGSGTSTNMNVNEVLANLAGSGVHPNDHVNMGQSSNDTFPSAVHLAALDAATNDLLPALTKLEASLATKSEEFRNVVKSGRTHMMDATPIMLGQEFGGYCAQIRLARERISATLEHVGQIPLGGTAVGTGLNTHPEFAEKVRQKLTKKHGLTISAPHDTFEAQASRDALVELSGALKVIAVSCIKISNDIRMMGSGPRAGFSEIELPNLQKGSSIMPGKVNPVMVEMLQQVSAQIIGNDTAITHGAIQSAFELNVAIPLISRNIMHSLSWLTNAVNTFATKCVDGLTANVDRCESYAEGSLSTATALNPFIGYDEATAIVQEAHQSAKTIREVARERGVEESVLDKALDLRAMTTNKIDK